MRRCIRFLTSRSAVDVLQMSKKTSRGVVVTAVAYLDGLVIEERKAVPHHISCHRTHTLETQRLSSDSSTAAVMERCVMRSHRCLRHVVRAFGSLQHQQPLANREAGLCGEADQVCNAAARALAPFGAV